MMGLEQTITTAILIIAVIIMISLIILVMRIKDSLQQQVQSQAAMQSDLRALCNAAVQVGERVNRIEGGLKALQQRQQELGVRQDHLVQSESQEVSFEQAIKMARKGSSVEELMEICSLSRGEAELISMMHRLDENA